jgi:hypothetical protein
MLLMIAAGLVTSALLIHAVRRNAAGDVVVLAVVTAALVALGAVAFSAGDARAGIGFAAILAFYSLIGTTTVFRRLSAAPRK